MTSHSLKTHLSPLLTILVLSALCTGTKGIRLYGVSTNTSAGSPSSLSGNFESDGKFKSFLSGHKIFAYMTTSPSSTNINFYLSGGPTSTYSARPYSTKITLLLKDPLKVYFSEYGGAGVGAKGTRGTLQVGSGDLIAVVTDQVDVATSSRQSSTVSIEDPTSGLVFVAGSQDWMRFARFDMLTTPLYQSLAISPLHTSYHYGKAVALLEGTNQVTVTGYYSHQTVYDRTTVAFTKVFTNPPIQGGGCLLNNLDEEHYYLDRNDPSLFEVLDIDLVNGAAPNLLFNFPAIVRPSNRGRGMINVGNLQFLALGDKVSPELVLIDKLTFTTAYIANFPDGIATSGSSLRGGFLKNGDEFHVGRIEATNKNFQQFFFRLDNCSYRDSTSLCTACSPGFYRTNLTSANECIEPLYFPSQTGKDNPNQLVKPCSPGCTACLANFASCTHCDTSNGYFPLGTTCYTVPYVQTVFPGAGLNTTSLVFEPCVSQGCLDCASDKTLCVLCDSSNGYFPLSTTCFTQTTVPNGYGFDSTSSSFVECSQGNACTQCAADFEACGLCNFAAGNYPLFSGNTCYTTSNVTSGHGLDTANSYFRTCLQNPGCSDCPLNFAQCKVCSLGKYLALGVCYDAANIPDGFGIDGASSELKTCSQNGCVSCQADFAVCHMCDTMTSHYPLGDACYTVSTVPDGFGLDSTNSSFEACLQNGSCVRCGGDRTLCSKCDHAAGFYLYENWCFEISAQQDSLDFPGVSPVPDPCSSPACLACDSPTSSCSNCPISSGYYSLFGYCIQKSEAPQKTGLDLGTNKTIRMCEDGECLDCSEDYTKCTICSNLTTLKDNKCVACIDSICGDVSDTCKLDISKTTYDQLTNEMTVHAVDMNKIMKNYGVTGVIESNKSGKVEYDHQDMIVTIMSDRIIVKMPVSRTIYQATVILLFKGKTDSLCVNKEKEARIDGSITVTDKLSSFRNSSKTASTNLVIYGTIVSVFLASNRGGISNLLEKLMASFIWLKVLNGPQLLYPTIVLNNLNFKKSGIFGLKNPFEQISADPNCSLPSQYVIGQIDCNFLVNFGDDIVFLACCIGIAILSYSLLNLSKKIFNPEEKKENQAKKEVKTSIFVSVVKYIDDSVGMKYLLIEAHSSSIEYISYGFIQIFKFKQEVWSNAGLATAIGFFIYFVFISFAGFKYIQFLKTAAVSLIEKKKETEPKSQKEKKSITELIQKEEIPCLWGMMEYAHESQAVPKRKIYLYWVLLENVRVLIIAFFLYVLVPFKIFQVIFATLLQMIFIFGLLDSRNRTSRLEQIVCVITAVFELVFCCLKIASFWVDDDFYLEEVIGLGLAAIVVSIITINVIYVMIEMVHIVIWVPLKRVFTKKSNTSESVLKLEYKRTNKRNGTFRKGSNAEKLAVKIRTRKNVVWKPTKVKLRDGTNENVVLNTVQVGREENESPKLGDRRKLRLGLPRQGKVVFQKLGSMNQDESVEQFTVALVQKKKGNLIDQSLDFPKYSGTEKLRTLKRNAITKTKGRFCFPANNHSSGSKPSISKLPSVELGAIKEEVDLLTNKKIQNEVSLKKVLMKSKSILDAVPPIDYPSPGSALISPNKITDFVKIPKPVFNRFKLSKQSITKSVVQKPKVQRASIDNHDELII